MSVKLNHSEISNLIPKAELHMHIEGSIEPELVVEISKRNKLDKFTSLEELKKRYQFENLDDFLNLINECLKVIKTKLDFKELLMSYLKKASSQNIKYCELFFGPQLFLNEGISLETIFEGYWEAMEEARQLYNIDSELIMCFDRFYNEEEAIIVFNDTVKLLSMQKDSKKRIIAIGLACSETNNPPSKFTNVFKLAKELNFKLVCHCCEEKNIPLDYIKQALDILKVDRIDHGIHSYADSMLFERLVKEKVPLTLCPISHIKLKVFKSLSEFPYKEFKEKGLLFSLNSDDPTFFGGYLAENYTEMAKQFNFELEDYALMAKNSFLSSFASEEMKEKYIKQVDDFILNYKDE